MREQIRKKATKQTNIGYHLSPTLTLIKRILEYRIILEWQGYWKLNENGTGGYTSDLIPKVLINVYHFISYTASFITGYGPFKACLRKFGCSVSDKCECEVGFPHPCILGCSHLNTGTLDDQRLSIGMATKHYFKIHTSKQTQTHPPTASTHLQPDKLVSTDTNSRFLVWHRLLSRAVPQKPLS